MQFAGQRTTLDFEPVGEPLLCYVRLGEDILPEPAAVVLTGITPQKTVEEGHTEAEFLKTMLSHMCLPQTIIAGFNNISFDDEFIRHTLFRNFYDPYEWQWADGRSKWDLMNVVRMVRALRPEGIEWPILDGKPSNKLELLTQANGIEHDDAHDALGDVRVTIAVAKLLHDKQPKMFEYLLGMRTKKAIEGFVSLEFPKPFVYTAGGTSIVYPVAPDPNTPGALLVYDLSIDPATFTSLSDDELKEKLFGYDKEAGRMQVRSFKLNAAPIIAPLGVLDEAARERLGIDLKSIEHNLASLQKMHGFIAKVHSLAKRPPYDTKDADAEEKLYDGFVGDTDKTAMRAVREASQDDLLSLHPQFKDVRLQAIYPRYKARNFPRSLNEEERTAWEQYRSERVARDMPSFSQELAAFAARDDLTEAQSFALQELQLWAESIMPLPD
jgi:exodeoxyribonuclease-1